MSFEENLKTGQIGEGHISKLLNRLGYYVVPVYEKEIHTGKGPRVFAPGGKIVAPDMMVFKGKLVFWIEAKTKTAFAWYRNHQCWTTGIDLGHYKEYCKLADETEFPVWLMFLQMGGQAKDSPPSPSGLYANDLSYLRNHEDHRSDNWGVTGMVYWNIKDLVKIAPIELSCQ